MPYFQQRSILDQELREFNENILQLSVMVEDALDNAMQALLERDTELARSVIINDQQVNKLRYYIEELALKTIATQQPMAGDLRRIIAAIHIAVELERMGDHAADIASLAERLHNEGEFDSLHKLPKMAQRAKKMMHEGIMAFVESDVTRARQLIASDDKIDSQYMRLRHEVMSEMRDDDYIRRASFLLWAGHDLERIGDRATNIAERVIFMVTGEFVETPSSYVEPDVPAD